MNIKIERMDHMGNGIGYLNNKVIFVPKTVVGDEVKIISYDEHKKYLRATKWDVVNPSIKRIASFCPYYDKCGGCHLQNLNYSDTLEYKKDRVKNILNKANITNDIEVIENKIDKNYRNKIELKVKDGQIGFYEKASHILMPIDYCMITKKAINNFISELKKMNIINGDVTLRCNYNDEILVSIKTEDKVILKEENYPQYKVVGIIINDICVYGEDHYLEKINNLFFEVSYNSFFQVNSYINERLFELINKHVNGNTVLDLYSGVGTLSLMASVNAKKVYAIENIPNAVLNAIKNAKINNVQNVNFILGNVEDKIKFIDDDIDTVIVDPPRSGLDNYTIDKILELKPNEVIYISCETQKLAEDLQKFTDLYEVEKIYILDMFSYTYHVEGMVIMKKKTQTHKMNLNHEYYEMIKSGQKTIELRLFDEKRRQINIGDHIVFSDRDTGEELETKVENLHRFNSFEELYSKLPLLKCGYTPKTIDKASFQDMAQFYSLEEQQKYGVVGIELSVITKGD